jgi:hypothetical protein
MKAATSEVRNTWDEINDRLDLAREQIGELEHIAMENRADKTPRLK